MLSGRTVLGSLDNVEVLFEFLIGQVAVAVETLLVLMAGVSVVSNDILNFLGKDPLTVLKAAS